MSSVKNDPNPDCACCESVLPAPPTLFTSQTMLGKSDSPVDIGLYLFIYFMHPSRSLCIPSPGTILLFWVHDHLSDPLLHRKLIFFLVHGVNIKDVSSALWRQLKKTVMAKQSASILQVQVPLCPLRSIFCLIETKICILISWVMFHCHGAIYTVYKK